MGGKLAKSSKSPLGPSSCRNLSTYNFISKEEEKKNKKKKKMDNKN